ncbi:MAG: esterase-like activity of phytase family protein [Pseudomonadota bacterium]
MRSKTRLILALALAALCAPGNIVRTEIPNTMPAPEAIALDQVADASETGDPAWRVEGVWEYRADSLNFGGFSALLALDGNRLRAFSDRGFRFTFTAPDQISADNDLREVADQPLDPVYADELFDIEAATLDRVSGDYWLTFENLHAIQRYSAASEPRALKVFDAEVDWPLNAGAEALVRMADGRFLILPERGSEALLFASDPTGLINDIQMTDRAGELQRFDPRPVQIINPAPGFVVTDMSQLPDGRLIMLMRDVQWGYPPFASLLAIAALPEVEAETIRLQVALRFDGIIPSENYEALALREETDGSVAVWVMADSNKSIMQRDLLVKLRFHPGTSVER